MTINSNLFDSGNYREGVPEKLTVGDFWAWKRSDISNSYPTASYTLKYAFCRLASNHEHLTLTAQKVDSVHVIESAGSENESLTPDEYSYQVIIVRDSDSEQITLEQGYVTIDYNQDASPHPTDVRGYVLKTLQAVRDVIQNGAGSKHQSYSVHGRSLSRHSFESLLELEQEYAKRWNAIKNKSDLANGKKPSGKVGIRLGA